MKPSIGMGLRGSAVVAAIAFLACGVSVRAQDACVGAVPVAVPSTTAGTTVGATVDAASACGSATVPTAPGVWFSVTGTGNPITASLCDGTTTYDSQMSVFTDGCAVLTCVDGNNDFCGLQSEVSWCSVLGVEYLILIHGSGVASGTFTLVVTDTSCNDGNVCTDDACVAGVCQNTNNAAPCDDGLFCTATDVCTGGVCVGSGDPCPGQLCDETAGACVDCLVDADCNDGNVCTDDACVAGVCQNTNNVAPCDDGLFCTATDFCSGGVCLGSGDPCPGQLCDEAAGACVDCLVDADCVDGNACTADACVVGACVNTDTTPPGECCDPLTGATTVIDDGDVCTDDVCLADGTVIHTFNTAPCDDGDVCTVTDTCGFGVCAGVPSPDPLCTPTLSLLADPGTLPVGSCYGVGDTITMRVVMGDSATPIIGGQFFIEYDPARFAFVSIAPGDPPFTQTLFELINEPVGQIDYAVGAPPGTGGAVLSTPMAVITFQAIAECDTFARFRPHTPPTLLTDENGIPRTPVLVDLPPTSIDATAPVLTCPADMTVHADAGTLTAVVTWPEVTAADSCDGAIPVTCTSSPTSGLEGGGTFPPGITTISCDATNSCGVSSNCTFSVEVTAFNELFVDIQLSPTIVDGPLTRCITFELSQCGVVGTTVSQEITFGAPLNFPGRADNQLVLVPAGAWDCITARDELHTLRSTADDLTDDGTTYSATFLGDPEQEGNWLVGGNLNRDGEGVIDILDFGVFFAHFGISFPDTDCTLNADPSFQHADINGDGVVTLGDVTFITLNFLSTNQPNCCGQPGPLDDPATRATPVARISVRELVARGLGHLRVADLNNDGVLDVADMLQAVADDGAAIDAVWAAPGRR